MLGKRDFFSIFFFVISLRFDLEVKGHMDQGHVVQGQIAVPNKGSRQRQFASLY